MLQSIKNRWHILTGAMVLAVCLFTAGTANAAYQVGEGDTYLKIGGLLQTWLTMTEDAAPTGDDWAAEFYIRRMRLMFYGQVTDKVNFFIETDSPNFGKGGNLDVSVFIQDAYVELNLHPMFQMDFGMILLPFSHHGMQGATSLFGLDYHSALIKYPAGSTKVWRDFGVMFRGLLSKWLEYRLGVFRGAWRNAGDVERTSADGTYSYMEPEDPRNDKTIPRLTGRLTLNIFEPEGGAGVGGMFYDGLYLSKTDDGIVSTKKVLSIGASIDWQKDQNITFDPVPGAPAAGAPTPVRGVDETSDYVGVAGDVFLDLPLGQRKVMSLNGQVNFYYYNYGDRSDGDTYWDASGNKSAYTGLGIMSEIGFRYQAFQPLFLFDWYNSTKAADDDTGDYMGIFGGFNYWMLGHSVSFKAQFGADKSSGGDFGMAAKIQSQLLF